jgi:hypothetical protein
MQARRLIAEVNQGDSQNAPRRCDGEKQILTDVTTGLLWLYDEVKLSAILAANLWAN